MELERDSPRLPKQVEGRSPRGESLEGEAPGRRGRENAPELPAPSGLGGPVVEIGGKSFRVPDIGERFTVPAQLDEVFTSHGHYRVDGWLRMYPLRRPEDPKDTDSPGERVMAKFLQEDFDKRFKEPETEFRFRWCTREEATHVCGAGVAGTVSALEDIVATGEMVSWPAEHLESQRQLALRLVGEKADLNRTTIPWQNSTLKDALAKLPNLAEAIAAEPDPHYFYVYVDGHTVRGHKEVSDWERENGRTGPEHVWVEVAKRDEVPAFARK